MNILFESLLLLLSFYVLAIVVEEFFIQSLEIISQRLKLSSDIAGATFMAIGSSAPELFVSFLALFRISEQQSIGAGTIVGSAIFNILVIIGASALFKRALLTWQPVIRDLVFYIITILLLLFTFLDGKITLSDSLLFVGFYIIYLFSFSLWKKFFPYQTKADQADNQLDLIETLHSNKNIFSRFIIKIFSYLFIDIKKRPDLYLINFLISVLIIGALSYLMVESAVKIAHFFHISEVIIGLTILAAGTSIPDLLSSIHVAKQGRGDMAIANAVGSNIFDIAIGLGIPWLFIILLRGETIVVATENLTSSIILLFATVIALLFILITRKWEIGRYAGWLLIAGYVFYLFTQIGLLSFELCLNVERSYCFSL